MGTEGGIPNRIVARLASETGLSVEELPLLAEAVDPDALESLVSHTDRADACPIVRFEYAGHTVTVAGGGVVSAEPVPSDRA